MSYVDDNTKVPYGNLNWDLYTKFRPRYPPSLTQLVYTYRREHSNPGWERLVDLGAGNGNASSNYISNFQVVHVSDPSPDNIAKARKLLTGGITHRQLHTRLEFTQSTGEEAFKHVGENQADLVICATAAHFMDPDGMMHSIARMLRPGGTVAIYGYWIPIFPELSAQFNNIFATALGDAMKEAMPPGESVSIMSGVEARIAAGRGGKDYIPLPTEYFKDSQRIRINPNKQDSTSNKILTHILYENFVPAPSRATAHEQTIDYFTGTDPEAEGWSFMVDKPWIYGYIDTIRAPSPGRSMPGDKLFYEWEKAFDEECPTGRVRSLWTVHMILATRI